MDIDIDQAAKAIVLLFDMFSEHADMGSWIEELQDDYPELAAAVFKKANEDGE